MTDEASLSFEDAFQRLEDTVQRLEQGDLSLEEAIGAYEEGIRLARYCQDVLDRAELRVSQLAPNVEDDLVAIPFDPEG